MSQDRIITLMGQILNLIFMKNKFIDTHNSTRTLKANIITFIIVHTIVDINYILF